MQVAEKFTHRLGASFAYESVEVPDRLPKLIALIYRPGVQLPGIFDIETITSVDKLTEAIDLTSFHSFRIDWFE
jgi:hypothetical protein